MLQILEVVNDVNNDQITNSSLSDILGFFGFIWNVIQDLIQKIGELIIFLKDIMLFFPKVLNILPGDITIILIPTLTIVVFAAIYKFII